MHESARDAMAQGNGATCRMIRNSTGMLVTMAGRMRVACILRLFSLLVLAVPAALASACTVIEVRDSEGTTTIERRFGFASINMEPGRHAVMARSTVLGVAGTPLGMDVGYSDQAVALLPARCHLVLWVEHPGQVEVLRRQLQDREDICVVTP